MSNLNLKHQYITPRAPFGFDHPCAIYKADGEIKLDYICHRTQELASTKNKVRIVWPWLEEYEPTIKDWENIGFFVVREKAYAK